MTSSPSIFPSPGNMEEGRKGIDTLTQGQRPPLSPIDPFSPSSRRILLRTTSASGLSTTSTSCLDGPLSQARPHPSTSQNTTEKAAAIPENVLKVEQNVSEDQLQMAHVKDLEAARLAKTLTPQSGPRATNWIRFRLFFNTYRKFFTLVVVLNGVGVLLAAMDRFDYARDNAGAFILGNLLMAVMMRNELFLRGVYLAVNTCLAKWPPLWVRLGATSSLQHLGGIHSGCALSGLAWLIFRVSELCMHATLYHGAVISMGIVTTVAIVVSVISAFPWIRNTHHNTFERYHRFIGWFGLVSTWVFVVLGNGYDPLHGDWDWKGSHLIRTQELYLVLGMTIFVALPWTFTRRVPVDVEIPSPKVAILRFNRGMQQGLLGRIGRTSIMEYHAFGIVSEGTHAKYHYMVCGVQGDFTRALVDDPPKHIWTRELKFAGVSNTSTLYKRGIRICTGTGIGSALSTCLQNKDWFLIWIGSDNEKTFGKTIANLIENGIEPERRILWDTKKLKRPDTMKLLKETYDSWGAEVVFITSNLQGNTQMMEGCKMLGIPAFGTLWDF